MQQRLHLSFVADIGRHCQRLASLGFDQSDHSLELACAAARNDDARALACQPQRARPAHAGAATGDECRAVRKAARGLDCHCSVGFHDV